MKITHKIQKLGDTELVYLYIQIEDRYEFAKESINGKAQTSFIQKIKEYLVRHVQLTEGAAAVIVINGVVLGSLTLTSLLDLENKEKADISQTEIVKIYEEEVEEEKPEVEQKQEVEESKKENTEDLNKQESVTKQAEIKQVPTISKSEPKQTTNSVATTPKVKTPVVPETEKPQEVQYVYSQTIKLNNNGVVQILDLEEYIVGVVAAEMPASFSAEALKAQAVAARTYAMKKTSRGITLVNSTANQVYITKEQMQKKWGASYNTYYTKILNAVNATKKQVLKYNGEYIEAMYYAISNGSSELPKYVWNTNYPYLQAVSSSWDSNISAGRYTTTISYSNLSTKLGINVNKTTQIRIISRTEGDRVDEIKIRRQNL